MMIDRWKLNSIIHNYFFYEKLISINILWLILKILNKSIHIYIIECMYCILCAFEKILISLPMTHTWF
jgi:hypothetical protein